MTNHELMIALGKYLTDKSKRSYDVLVYNDGGNNLFVGVKTYDGYEASVLLDIELKYGFSAQELAEAIGDRIISRLERHREGAHGDV